MLLLLLLCRFLQLPHGVKVLKTLMTADGKKKKGALKNSHDSKSLGPMKVMDGIHSDGRPMRVEVECIAKDNKQYGAAAGQVAAPSGAGKTRYLLRIRFHKPGHGPKDFPKLVRAALMGMHSMHRPPAALLLCPPVACSTNSLDQGVHAVQHFSYVHACAMSHGR